MNKTEVNENEAITPSNMQQLTEFPALPLRVLLKICRRTLTATTDLTIEYYLLGKISVSSFAPLRYLPNG